MSEPTPASTTALNKSEIKDALADLRKKLLGLSGNNPLLNFSYGRSNRYLRLVDELPQQIVSKLLDGKPMGFEPVPKPKTDELGLLGPLGESGKAKEPKPEEWAAHCGIYTDFDVAVESRSGAKRRHSDLKLQTLHYAKPLEARLSSISRLAQSTIEETGANTLHLTVGFLEWYEDGTSDLVRQAPLIAIPVSLKKKNLNEETLTYEYELSHSGEDCQPNVSLAARLEQDFGYKLPDLEDGFDPENYFEKITNSIRQKFPRWKVRRFITLAFFNYGKLLMYRDLDPEKWPEKNRLEDNPLVGAVVGSASESDKQGEGGSNAVFADEYRIDEIDEIYDTFPIVDNADSSQHSALIDAVKGKNLVIEGPPGTGKSQTITNLIAAAMRQGKTVLFVSEKLAALEVVKQRLDRLGLGHFCLELHSHATQKAGVVESLKKRLELPPRPSPRAYDEEIARHRKLRDKLARHEAEMNAPFGDSGMSVHEILVGATRLSEELPEELRDISLQGGSAASWSRAALAEITQEAKVCQALVAERAEQLDGAPIEEAHPWRGLGPAEVSIGDQRELTRLLSEWNLKLQTAAGHWGKLAEVTQGRVLPDEIESIRRTLGEVSKLLSDHTDVCLPLLAWATGRGLEKLKELVSEWDKIERLIGRMEPPSEVPTVLQTDFEPMLAITRGLLGAEFSPSATLGEVIALLPETEQAVRNVKEIGSYFAEYVAAAGAKDMLPEELTGDFPSLSALESIHGLLAHLHAVTEPFFGFRFRDWLDDVTITDLRGVVSKLKELQGVRERFAETFALDSLPEPSELAGMVTALSDATLLKRLFSGAYRTAKGRVCGFLVGGKKAFDRNTVVEKLHSLSIHLEHERRFLQEVESKETLTGKVWQGMSTDATRLLALVDWHDWILGRFCPKVGGLFTTREPDPFGAWQLECPVRDLVQLTALVKVDYYSKSVQISNLEKAIKAIARYSQSPVIKPKDRLVDGQENQEAILETICRLFAGAKSLTAAPGITVTWNLGDIDKRLEVLNEVRRAVSSWASEIDEINQTEPEARIPDARKESAGASRMIRATHAWGTSLSQLGEGGAERSVLLGKPNETTLVRLREWCQGLDRCLSGADAARDRFAKITDLDPDKWTGEARTLSALISRNASALENSQMLSGYLDLIRSREQLNTKGLTKLVNVIQTNRHSQESIGDACRHAFLRGLSDSILEQSPKLQGFVGTRQQQVRIDFQELDKKLLEMTRAKLASELAKIEVPEGRRGVRVSEHTELELIKHEVNKQRRHIPIRTLLKRAGGAVQSLKPCFMMGPRSVAQYLDPGGLEFHLLVIDEASQMKPADAIGATARVKQLVVVGDPKQLPPTSFFDRMSGGESDGDEDQFAVGTAESILDAVLPVFTARRLRWHYRSKHEGLIAFSNRKFYDDNLLLFPSPGTADGSLGIRFHRVPDGRFSSQVNQEEALAVARRVEELLCQDPLLSLGVATMSAKQRDYVEEIIDRLAKENPIFNTALAKNRDQYESLFVKNLESVQGDERSVMLISCTYGPEEIGGRVPQRFGPINSATGWRRLNVLFTRSKERMEIFSSMDAGDVLASETSSRGVQSLKEFLHYAATNILETGTATGRPPDSDFEIAVGRMLSDAGFEYNYQVGIAGFFIDLAVKNPNRPGEYIMGIECDGATYHTGKSVRDRDRLRQEILESLGWTIRRIWSTDWFANPHGALAPIIKELQAQGSQK